MLVESEAAPALLADVRVGETLDAVYVRPRHRDQSPALLRLLSHAVPRATIRGTPDGYRVNGIAAGSLLDGVEGLRLDWEPSARRFAENRRGSVARQLAAHLRLTEIKALPRADLEGLIAGSEGISVLDEHQIRNVAAMTMPGTPGLCVFDEQGAGKTVTLIFAFDLLAQRDEADRVIVIAPKSMVPEWPRDFARFRGGLYRVETVAGSAKEKRRALAAGAEILVTNYETAVAFEGEITALVRATPGRTVLAIDESFFVKSLDAQRTRALRRIREWCGRAFVLCGTPAPNSAHDLVQQFSMVDFGACFGGVDVPEDRTAAAPVVQAAVDERGLFLRHLKADVLPDLPGKAFQKVFVPMEDGQQRAYEAALQNLIVDLQSTSDTEFARRLPNFLARRAALLQICSNPAAVVPGYIGTPAKIAALDSLLERLIAQSNEKVIVWSFFTGSIDAITSRYASYGVVRYDGKVASVDQRRDAVRRFQEEGGPMLMVANPAAAGAGLTLHRARYAIYESLSNQAAHYLQSLDRIHRRGQEREVEYLMLLCQGSIEIQEYATLVRKEAAAQSLLGDQTPAHMTREAFLADAQEAANLLRALGGGA